jgi:hypothetical protein
MINSDLMQRRIEASNSALQPLHVTVQTLSFSLELVFFRL